MEIDESFDITNSDFMMAFTLQQWDGGYKDDPRYIQWTMQVTDVIDGDEKKIFYPLHKCTDEEFERFYAIEKRSAIKVAKIQADGKWMCFDWR